MSEHGLSTLQPPLAMFIAHKAEIDDLLNRIQLGSADQFDAQPDGVHWGNVGSLRYVVEQLRAIAAFMAV